MEGKQMVRLTHLLILTVILTLGECEKDAKTKAYPGEIFVHVMPWFETKTSSGDNKWGIHWTMTNQNPDIQDGSGKRQIASHFYPEIGPYASGDLNVIEYQLLLMKYSGVDGILIDWPGTTNAFDYPKNLQNSEAIIAGAEKFGLKFAIVYEDHNIKLAGIPENNQVQAGQKDINYARDKYFNRVNYIRVNGNPLLLDFGPQTFKKPSDWTTIFSEVSPKPTFLTLWYQIQDAVGSVSGEYCWIYSDFLNGLDNFYKNHPLDVKFGVGYPGFNTFYKNGGWPGPDWTLPNSPDTLGQTLDLAIKYNVNWIQIATWNDYGEGTMVEPTLEFGNSLLETIQKKKGMNFTGKELNIVKTLFLKRVQYAGDPNKTEQLNQASDLLNQLKPIEAENLLATL